MSKNFFLNIDQYTLSTKIDIFQAYSSYELLNDETYKKLEKSFT